MKRYFLFVLLVLVLELGLLYGIAILLNTNLADTMFIGSLILVFFAFIMSSTGDVLSRNTQRAVFNMSLGSYKPEREKTTLSINPFLVGSILCLVAYFVLYYFGGLS
ncbi:hypothetical protein [Cytobacillus gottheilii]|uniref:hypothetical protein n=1 Tax=Cytobacillus gottheilii TaxID=859144 RepID=UPI00111AB9C1|nr:hypothetical protein [Cytobacillus gottheilii]